MELKTFDTILTELCDNFDALISPKTILRSNTNIIYLLFKAIAKGFEVINNTCVTLSNKFDPSSCTVSDLNSIASLVGTERLKGSASGLHIIVTNKSALPQTLSSGVYSYAFDDDTTFIFEILEDTVIKANSYITVIAMSENIGSFPVTSQSSITVKSDRNIPEDLSFSCTNNSSLLGTVAETDLEFRKRVIEGYDNQDSIVELQNEISNLPYIFDCKIKFNNTMNTFTYDGIDIPPFTCAIFYSGSLRSEIAEVIANRIICPTVSTENSVSIAYKNEVFVGDEHIFNLIPFGKEKFSIEIRYSIDNTYINDFEFKEQVQNLLSMYYVTEKHQDYVRENDVYNIIETLNITGVNILDVNLLQNGEKVSYIKVPLSRIAELEKVFFEKEGA